MKIKELISEVWMLSIASFIIAASVFFFLMPAHAAIASISGLSIVLHELIHMPVSLITLVLNVVLLIIGFFTCGSEFGIKTVYTSILMPLFIAMFEHLFPNFQSLSGSQELDAVCYIFTVSVGLAILFNRNASSGGLDILEKIMNRYMHVNLGTAMMVLGMAIALSSAFAYDTKTVVISVLGSYLNGIVLDHFIFDQSLKRRVCIVSDHLGEIRKFIIEDLHSGATIYEATGAYRMEKRREIIVIVDRQEYQKLMRFLEQTDPKAFITIYKVTEMHYIPKIWSSGR